MNIKQAPHCQFGLQEESQEKTLWDCPRFASTHDEHFRSLYSQTRRTHAVCTLPSETEPSHHTCNTEQLRQHCPWLCANLQLLVTMDQSTTAPRKPDKHSGNLEYRDPDSMTTATFCEASPSGLRCFSVFGKVPLGSANVVAQNWHVTKLTWLQHAIQNWNVEILPLGPSTLALLSHGPPWIVKVHGCWFLIPQELTGVKKKTWKGNRTAKHSFRVCLVSVNAHVYKVVRINLRNSLCFLLSQVAHS